MRILALPESLHNLLKEWCGKVCSVSSLIQAFSMRTVLPNFSFEVSVIIIVTHTESE